MPRLNVAVDGHLTLSQALRAASECLAEARVDSPRPVAEALLSRVLHLSRAQVLARPDQRLSPGQTTHYQSLVDRCASGEPFAYVLGRREFYGLDFAVDRRVLIPRPETELLIDTALDIAHSCAAPELRIADIGTGSGAIAVTLAVHLPRARFVATDISPDALVVARQNALRHGVADRIAFEPGDLLAPIDAPVDLIAANLPYVRTGEWEYLALSIRHYEPSIAFDGGADGLALVHRLLRSAPRALKPGGSVLAEIGASQGEAAIELARDVFATADIRVHTDLARIDRLLVVRTGPI
jgi:release factor glutamine methyltransferase